MKTSAHTLATRKVTPISLGAFTRQTKGGGNFQKVDDIADFRMTPALSND